MATNHSKPLPKFTTSQIDSFWRFVDKSPGQGPEGECWTWTGAKHRDGYGKFSIRQEGHANPKTLIAHRVAFVLGNGTDPIGLLACHTCDFKPCVRPSHLFAGTHKDNNADMAQKGRAASGDRNAARLYPEKWRRGEAHHNAKLTRDKVEAIRSRRASGETSKALAAEFGVHYKHINRIAKGIGWLNMPDTRYIATHPPTQKLK